MSGDWDRGRGSHRDHRDRRDRRGRDENWGGYRDNRDSRADREQDRGGYSRRPAASAPAPAPTATGPRETGEISWFNATKGYGFIKAQGDRARDVFVHVTALEVDIDPDALRPGDPVSFVAGSDPRSGRERAQDVRLAPDDRRT